MNSFLYEDESVLYLTSMPSVSSCFIGLGISLHLGTLAITSNPASVNFNKVLYHRYSLPPQEDLLVETNAIFLFKDFLPGFIPTFFWGLAVQLSQVVCIYFIMLSLHIPFTQHEWIFIFLASAVISILPISLGGGLGTREVVFAEGARFFHLDPQLGVVISLLFYLLTVIGSLWGLYYNFHDPLTNNEQGTRNVE